MYLSFLQESVERVPRGIESSKYNGKQVMQAFGSLSRGFVSVCLPHFDKLINIVGYVKFPGQYWV